MLPGHGDPVTDHKALIGERLGAPERRAEDIRALVAEAPAHRTRDRPGHLGGHRGHARLPHALRVLGHTDLLLQRGSVREVQDGPVVHFETV